MDRGAVLGVDFGTSNTAAVLGDPVRPLLFDGLPQLPSAVFVAGDTRLAGRDALHRSLGQPARLEPNPKRRIDEGTVLLGDDEVAVAALIAVVLRRVADEAVRTAGGPLDAVLLTHPASWGPRRLAVLVEAAGAAGLPEPVTLPEPVAAAEHYAATAALPVGRPVLVFDLGAGTCDATVVRRTADGIDVVATQGLDDVGGLDVDAAIVTSIAATVRPDDPAWPRLRRPGTAADLRARTMLWDGVRTAKEQLSRTGSTFVYIPLLDVEVPLGREEFDALARPVLAPTVRLARAVIDDAGLTHSDLAAVVLVGGSSRLPLLASLLHAELGRAPTVIDQPELAVALGSVAATVRDRPAGSGRAEIAPAAARSTSAPHAATPPAPSTSREDTETPAETARPAEIAGVADAKATRPVADAKAAVPAEGRSLLLGLAAMVAVIVLLLGLLPFLADDERPVDSASPEPTSGPSSSTPAPPGPDLAMRWDAHCDLVPAPDSAGILLDIRMAVEWHPDAGGGPVPAPFTVVLQSMFISDPARVYARTFAVDMELRVGAPGPRRAGWYWVPVPLDWLGESAWVEVFIDREQSVREVNEDNNRVEVIAVLPEALPTSVEKVPCTIVRGAT
jgi:hypothetical protein